MTTLKVKIAKITIVTYLSAHVSTLLFPRFSRRIQIIGRSETRCRARGCPFSFYSCFSYMHREYKTKERENASVNKRLFNPSVAEIPPLLPKSLKDQTTIMAKRHYKSRLGFAFNFTQGHIPQ